MSQWELKEPRQTPSDGDGQKEFPPPVPEEAPLPLTAALDGRNVASETRSQMFLRRVDGMEVIDCLH